jgi:hypothetical protein
MMPNFSRPRQMLAYVILACAWLSESMPSAAPYQQTLPRTGNCADNGHFAASRGKRNCACKALSRKGSFESDVSKGAGVCSADTLWESIRGEIGTIRLRGGGGVYGAGPGPEWRNSDYYAPLEYRGWTEQSNRAEYGGHMQGTERNREMNLEGRAGTGWEQGRREAMQMQRILQENGVPGDSRDRIDPVIMDEAGRIAAQALAAVSSPDRHHRAHTLTHTPCVQKTRMITIPVIVTCTRLP